MEGNGRWLRSGVLSKTERLVKGCDVMLGTMGSPFTAIELSLQDKPPAGWQACAEEDVSRADAHIAARTPAGVLDRNS